jgi:hypothetical protein
MRNFCTYYWSVEHGRNDRLIQRMHEYLCGHRELEEAGAKSKRKAGAASSKPHQSTACCNINILLRTSVTAVAAAATSEETVASAAADASGNWVHFIVSSDDDGEQGTFVERREFFDAVLLCTPPHIASSFFPEDSAIRREWLDHFERIPATSVVHTDKEGIANASGNPRTFEDLALVYEKNPLGWVLHIDADRYYGVPKPTSNVVSITYDGTHDDKDGNAASSPLRFIDKRKIKGRFHTVLSRDKKRRPENQLRSWNADPRNTVHLCASYFAFEQWSQDAFRIGTEVADLVLAKARGRQRA